ncbi:hypothetical protein Y032_0681g1475 [Ancylostoma ceylanicum]|uniref:Uncharacterized protein n=1 Tax=Ancylostoma ceylanicum TaxID=53326 RepID=A0A016WGS9_9BILA|nr:hypothetical protein Y032_0681g1475 [Ancylostoma ceylanicum]
MEEIPLDGNTCSACAGRNIEMIRLQEEVQSLKKEIGRITSESKELSTSLQDIEAVVDEKDEMIRSLELSLSIEQQTRMSLDADLQEKTNECLTLIQSLEALVRLGGFFPEI